VCLVVCFMLLLVVCCRLANKDIYIKWGWCGRTSMLLLQTGKPLVTPLGAKLHGIRWLDGSHCTMGVTMLPLINSRSHDGLSHITINEIAIFMHHSLIICASRKQQADRVKS